MAAASFRWILQLHKDVPKAARFYSEGLDLTVNVCTLRWAELQSGPLKLALMQSPKYLLKDTTGVLFLGSLFLKKHTSVLVGSVVSKGCIFSSLKGLPRYASAGDVVLVFSHVYYKPYVKNSVSANEVEFK
uniref:Uncharacterized protein n=1 Tax=Quercus lobata TaxID=97700 RepID=A0A7N2KV06_QUELO